MPTANGFAIIYIHVKAPPGNLHFVLTVGAMWTKVVSICFGRE